MTTNLYQVGFDAVWEIDVFGANRRAIEAADATTAAALESERGVRVSLLAEIAVEYMQLREDQLRESIARQNLELQQKRRGKMPRDKFDVGLGKTSLKWRKRVLRLTRPKL